MTRRCLPPVTRSFRRLDDYRIVALKTKKLEMASITKDGVALKEVHGTPEEEAALEKSYKHLCALRDEVIAMGVLPAISEWHKLNPNIK